jgi:secretion/DNA translocation related TadE-like protein
MSSLARVARAVLGRCAPARARLARSLLVRARDDRGSASIWVLGIALAVVSLAVSVAWAAGVLIAHHRAQAAADLGALAGAPYAVQGLPAACAAAGRVVEANAARMVDCGLVGLDIMITVETQSFGRPGRPMVFATARAGPERTGPDGAEQIGPERAEQIGPERAEQIGPERVGAPPTGGDG